MILFWMWRNSWFNCIFLVLNWCITNTLFYRAAAAESCVFISLCLCVCVSVLRQHGPTAADLLRKFVNIEQEINGRQTLDSKLLKLLQDTQAETRGQ